MKNLRLNFRSVSKEHLNAMASETLHAMPDGRMFAGLSPDTGKAMFATPADAPLADTFNAARKDAKDHAHSHHDYLLKGDPLSLRGVR